MLDPDIINPEVSEFLAGMITGYLAKRGEDILKKSTDRFSEFLKGKLGKNEIEKIRNLETLNAKKRLEELVKSKNLTKEVHTFYVIYKYLEKFTADSRFLRVMDFRRGEGIPLDRIYVKLQVVEEKKKNKDVLTTSRYYDEDYYYQAREMRKRSKKQSRKISPDKIMALDKGLVYILGLPGAGKTTLCKYFCWKTLKGDYVKQRFPIYIELRGVKKEEDPVTYALHSKLKEYFTQEEIEETIATIKHNTDIFSPLFIFDGLDEVKVGYETISESIRNCADSSPCIVTSRRSGFIYLQHDRTYEILPLGREEKEKFVRNYFTQIEEANKIESFLHILGKKEYDSLSKNPMLLSILCALASDEEDVKTLPSRKIGLYRKIVAKMNEWHKSKGGQGLSQEEIRTLEDLALSLFRKKRPKILFEGGIDENILGRAIELGLIYKWDELRYSFLHLTLQEYFAARCLRSLEGKWEEIVREKKDVVSWHEILQLFASVLSEEEEYKELKKLFYIVLESPDILHLNYALAGHCLAEIDMDEVVWSDEILGKISHEFEENECRDSFIEAFVHLGGRAVDPLLNLLQKTDDDWLNRQISFALGEIGDPRAVDPLLDLLQKTDSDWLKERIPTALGRIGDKALDPLLDLLQETDSDWLKERIPTALGRIGDKALDPLLDLLQKTDDDKLKEQISEALGRIRDPRAVDPLLDLLQKTDDDKLKEQISLALGLIGDSRAVDPLLNILQKTDNNHLKEQISEALGRIRDPRALDPLLDLLQKTDDDKLKEQISEALGRIRDPRAVDPLLDLLQKTDSDWLSGRISLALGEIGDPRAVDPLLDLLQETTNDWLKMRISYALGLIGDPRAVDPLLDLLQKTDDDELKLEASLALGRIGDEALDPLLNILQKTDDDELIEHISFALGEIGDSRAVDPLLNILQETENGWLKGQISFALAGIGDPRAVDPLLNILQKTDDDELKSMISDALESFNPLYFYSFMENKMLQPIILDILCFLSTRFNIRFFKDKVVLQEGDILHVETEAQRKHSIKKLDEILKLKKE